jgi:hypothetical protein
MRTPLQSPPRETFNASRTFASSMALRPACLREGRAGEPSGFRWLELSSRESEARLAMSLSIVSSFSSQSVSPNVKCCSSHNSLSAGSSATFVSVAASSR